MRTSKRLEIIVHILNFIIFLYFSVTLIKIGLLDIVGLLIAAVGLFASISVSILSALERTQEQ